ncbi:hypothetical protein ACIBL6_13715 [Streptomyces sp. NPDC050400]|uniref:hypothetical protein n=1 Tax=Streptomyces sp. NPDC050400 TaxID=3365610 RepID=UPI00378F7BC2
MTPPTPRADPADHPETPTEQRLRAALTARADTITPVSLSPARPPRPDQRRLPRLHHTWRRYALPLAGLATAATIVVAYIALTPEPDPDPAPPATPPSPTAPHLPPTSGPSQSTPSTLAPTPKPDSATPSTSSPPSPPAPDDNRPTPSPSSP